MHYSCLCEAQKVVLRLSPLLLLTPASVAAAHFLGVEDDDTESTIVMRKTHHPTAFALRTSRWIRDFSWWYTTSSMQALGPAWVKLMQWVATRRDMFPPHICNRLAPLHDQGSPHSWEHTHSQLVAAFGRDYAQELDIPPDAIVGCGSAAQVYVGTLLRSSSAQQQQNNNDDDHSKHRGIAVAVKVLHPNFRRNVERDMWLMTTIGKLLHSLPFEQIRMVNLPHATANFASVLSRQADLRTEAENLQQFRDNFYRNDARQEERSDIIFPRPLLATEKVMLQEFVDHATPMAHFLRDSSPQGQELRKQLSGPLLRAFFKMVFVDNFVHGDLHPGNVMVVPTNSCKIVFLDAGIAVSLNPTDQKNLKDLFRAVILNNGNQAGRLMVERAKYERCTSVPGGKEAFAAGVEAIVSEFHDRRKGGLTLGAVRIGSLLGSVLDLCRIHGVEIDPAMASIVISTLVLEGLGRSLEPGLNLIDAAIPFVLGRGRV